MRRPLVLLAAALPLWGCSSDSTHPRNAAKVSVSPGSITLDAVGATRVVHASAIDEGGSALSGISFVWASSSDAVTVSKLGGDSALVTAVSNGDASVRAVSGSAAGSIAVHVAQVAVEVRKVAGDAQTALAGTTLPAQLAVKVVDRLGVPIPGKRVDFAASGGGSVSPTSTTTAADGTASAVWTLGTSTSTRSEVVASTPGVTPPLTFTATVTPGPASAASVAAGGGQAARAGEFVRQPPSVRVTDAFGNGIAGVAVTFAVTSGGGAITGPSAITDATGAAQVGSWQLGATPGVNTLTATIAVPGVAPVVITATAVTTLAATVSVVEGSDQAAMAGTAVSTAPKVVVRDSAGGAVSGVTVTFAVASGGGSVTGASAVTGADGVASTGWVLGSAAGPNRLTATVPGVTAAEFAAIGCSGGGGAGYAITLCPTTPLTPTQRAAFENAAARWQGLITGDLPDVADDIPFGTCGPSPALHFTVDDLVIFAGVEDIDGVGQILGQAGWCVRRSGGLPVAGLMRFDAADVATLESGGQFASVIMHEMGHVLGIGTLWNAFGLLQNPTGPVPLDTWFSGTNALTGFNAIGGSSYTGGQKVPVENTGGSGTSNSHWRETVLKNELMTGFLNSGVNPLSELTVRSLADLGYSVNPAGADPFFLTLSLQTDRLGTSRGGLQLVGDVYEGPGYSVDRRGRFTRIR